MLSQRQRQIDVRGNTNEPILINKQGAELGVTQWQEFLPRYHEGNYRRGP
jgi:hypothetical protein